MHCQNIKPDFLHASVCLKEILLAFNGTVITSSDIINSSSNTQSSSTQRKQVYLDSTTLNTLHYLHSNSNLQVNCPTIWPWTMTLRNSAPAWPLQTGQLFNNVININHSGSSCWDGCHGNLYMLMITSCHAHCCPCDSLVHGYRYCNYSW